MSLISDQVRRLDAYLDRLPVLSTEVSSKEGSSNVEVEVPEGTFAASAAAAANTLDAPRLNHLLRIVQSLSSTTSSTALLPLGNIKYLLHSSGIPDTTPEADVAAVKNPYETEIQWLLVSKATIQLHGTVMNDLLDRIIPLSDDIWYWDEVLNSYTYSSLYTVQVSPVRFWAWSQEIYIATKSRIESVSSFESPSELVGSTRTGLSQKWGRFYGIVKDTIHERSFSNIQRKVLSPVAFSRAEARKKQAQLKKLREITASGLGALMDEGLNFNTNGGKAQTHEQQDLKRVIERSVALMNMVLKEVSQLESDIDEFEDKIFVGVEQDSQLLVHAETSTSVNRPAVVSRRLLHIIDKILPQHEQSMHSLVKQNGRPHALVRYWLPAIIGLLSSTTILRILVNRKADIVDWITDFGSTVRDFWFNWVIEPTQKVIRTIRHDDSSEIAIMSRDSLKADRESLERMVIDFAIDNPHFAVDGLSLSESQIAEIRAKVAEGDVTPVLKAYEKDLRKPFVGAVRGDLVRSLLIQVQKTKVDLEVAMTGIDSLLKSQELVFGFVGLTPGVLVSLGIFRYLSTIVGGRTGRSHSKKATRAVRVLRNIDRILAEATPTENNVLSYKDHGLLLCEVHVLRNLAHRLMPKDLEKEFLEDVDDLSNSKGIRVQSKALDRIRWAYGKWLK